MKTIIIIAGLLIGSTAMAGGMSGDQFETKRTKRDLSSEKVVAEEKSDEKKDEAKVEKKRPFHHQGSLENAR